jgi:4-phytase/acid phosphatase
MRFTVSLAALTALIAALPTTAAPKVERVVMIMRHGVRAPITGEVPADTRARGVWPTWPVAPEVLTLHGADMIRQVARYDRRWLTSTGCPPAGSVRIWTNTAERTIATGRAWADGLAPGCALPVGHLDADRVDPLFEPLRARATAFDARQAVAAINRHTGGVDALTARHDGAGRRW